MSNVPSDSRVSSDAPVDIDKRSLYGEFIRNSRWRDALHKKVAHKALDVPEDEVITTSSVTNSGTGWKELLVIAVALVGAGGIAAFAISEHKAAEKPATVAPVSPAAPAADKDTDTKYQLKLLPEETPK